MEVNIDWHVFTLYFIALYPMKNLSLFIFKAFHFIFAVFLLAKKENKKKKKSLLKDKLL